MFVVAAPGQERDQFIGLLRDDRRDEENGEDDDEFAQRGLGVDIAVADGRDSDGRPVESIMKQRQLQGSFLLESKRVRFDACLFVLRFEKGPGGADDEGQHRETQHEDFALNERVRSGHQPMDPQNSKQAKESGTSKETKIDKGCSSQGQFEKRRQDGELIDGALPGEEVPPAVFSNEQTQREFSRKEPTARELHDPRRDPEILPPYTSRLCVGVEEGGIGQRGRSRGCRGGRRGWKERPRRNRARIPRRCSADIS